ncbi:MAG: hypothetical protein ABI782_09165 [Anaerolineaceae bacterium]
MSYYPGCATRFAGEIARVFASFKDPRNLEARKAPRPGFCIVSASDETVRRGTRILYRLRIAGIQKSWESRITECQDGLYVADEQIIGPCRRWYHRPTFRTVPAGFDYRTRIITDRFGATAPAAISFDEPMEISQ